MKKWLTKKDETKIIAAYSIRPGDIKPLDAIEHTYVYFPAARAGKAALLKIERETTKTTITGRILVTHSDNEGHIIVVDAWARDDQGLYQWVCRNPADMPLSDQEIFEDYEKQISEMKKKYREYNESCVKIPDISSETLITERSVFMKDIVVFGVSGLSEISKIKNDANIHLILKQGDQLSTEDLKYLLGKNVDLIVTAHDDDFMFGFEGCKLAMQYPGAEVILPNKTVLKQESPAKNVSQESKKPENDPEVGQKPPVSEGETKKKRRRRTNAEIERDFDEVIQDKPLEETTTEFMNIPEPTERIVLPEPKIDTKKSSKRKKKYDVDDIIRKSGVDEKFKDGVKRIIEKGVDPNMLPFNLKFELSPWDATDEDIDRLTKTFLE